jgi:hypothetical protein
MHVQALQTKEDVAELDMWYYGEEEKFIQSFGGKPEGKRPPERPRRRGSIILKLTLKNWDDRVWPAFTGIRLRLNRRLS